MALHGFSTHGTGGGSGPVGYFVAGEYYAKSVDEKGEKVAQWKPREPLPQVIEGDPALMIAMIDAVQAKHKYTSGVLSFTAEDTLKLKTLGLDEAVQDITARLKEMLFAGISEEHQHILIVAQTHLDRLELHYVTPRWNYEVDRAFNPAPPGSKKFEAMDALMDFINVKYGLDDPRDPMRARVTKNPLWTPQETKPLRDQLNSFFTDIVADGVINNRVELIKFAKNAGFEITRTGADYIGIKAPGSDKAVRLKGEIFNERFTSRTELANTQGKSAERAAYLEKSAVVERYKNAVSERRAFIEKRFSKALSNIRRGKTHEETRSFYAKSRGKSIEVSKNGIGSVRPNNNSKRVYKDDVNDGFGKEIDSIITRAERNISDRQRSTHRANSAFYRGTDLLTAGATVVKAANQRLEAPQNRNYAFLPSTPADAIAVIGESTGTMDSGDAEADRVINKKRSESGSLNNKLRQIEAANKKNSGNYSPA
jgi:hypothetical protein